MMEPRTYQAPTMAMVLGEIKRDLGPSAVILKTRRFRKGGMLGLIGGRLMWEVKASPGTAATSRSDGVYLPSAGFTKAGAGRFSGPAGVEEPSRQVFSPPPEDQTAIASRMAEIHRMVGALLSKQAGEDSQQLPVAVAVLKQALLDQDVAASIVVELVGELCASVAGAQPVDEDLLRSRLLDLMARRLKTVSPGAPSVQPGKSRTVCLVGPTGVGKTTTIAKLAANYKLREHKKVGLVTIDNYRIAAVDQLRTYAEIIDVPMEAVLTPGELHRAVRGMADRDVVLIDTAGRSQNDEMRLNELRRFVETADCDEVHLVVSAAASPRVADSTVGKFAALRPNRIIVTKLDEAATFGMILNVAAATDAALSYVTTGQDVPDDIGPAKADVLAESILRGGWHAG